MRPSTGVLCLGFAAAAAGALPPPIPTLPQELPGHYVRWDRLDECPRLTPRDIPTRSDDVRPDDFSLVMAIGDSITAALLARDGRVPSPRAEAQTPFSADADSATLPDVQEWRGLSYAIGGDEDALTLPRIMAHYTNVSGASTGHHPVACIGIETGACHPPSDNLNGAISGSVASSLYAQVSEYIVPKYHAMPAESKRGWTFVNLGIGANDICAFCLTSNIPFGPGTPEEFVAGIRDAIELLRRHIPRMIVNIVGLFRVSAVYELTRDDPYCQGPFHPPVPHLPLECSCSMFPGPTGDYTRRRMDALGEAYDRAVLELLRDWHDEGNTTFAAIWQPGSALDLENYPVQAVSPVDCFHPSEAAHRRLAAGLWNRLVLPLAYKAVPFPWEDDIWVRCLEDDDRIQVHDIR